MSSNYFQHCHKYNDIYTFSISMFILSAFLSTQTDFTWPSPLLGGNLADACQTVIIVSELWYVSEPANTDTDPEIYQGGWVRFQVEIGSFIQVSGTLSYHQNL